ncbi:MAG: tRNA-queuosine alpha-mannosyltransferase domain-containing protein [Halofilum sp. (in: g-proteobacteria)]
MSQRSVLLLSAYRADSHASWADWLVRAHPGIAWQRLELPGRHFRWRIRGNPLSWVDRIPVHPPDLILATSMVDLATLRGLQPALAEVPAWYYFHENQFAYPVSARQVKSVEPQIVQLYGALAAQRLLFNSAFNRDTFLDGVEGLLRRMPDHVPAGIRERLAPKASVYPVPVAPIPPGPARDERLILWNHRWEYDKEPELFADALLALADNGIAFRLALLGSRPHKGSDALARIRGAMPERIVVDGRVEAREYRQILGQAGIAVSTARHEFQGLAMLEAVSAGATPLVPDALCYREQYPAVYRYPAWEKAPLVARLFDWLENGRPQPPDVSAWTSDRLTTAWRDLIFGATAIGSARGGDQ